MARVTVTKGSFSAEVAGSISTALVMNIGPGVGTVVASASAPTGDPADTGFRLQAGQALPMANLGGSVGLYVGAVSDACTFEYLTS